MRRHRHSLEASKDESEVIDTLYKLIQYSIAS